MLNYRGHSLMEISCLIPVYNVEKYVERCMVSVFSNTIADKVEFVIINDCTPDGSMDIAKTVISRFSNLNIKIINHESNQGLAVSRNTGLDNSNGKYICFVDSDDYVEPDYFEKLYNLIESDKNNDLAFLGYEAGNELSFENDTKTFTDNFFVDLISDRLKAYLWHKIFKREIVNKYNIRWIPGLNMYEDLVFLIQYLCRCKKIVWNNDVIYHYTVRKDSISQKKVKDSDILQILKVFQFCDDFLTENNMMEEKVREAFLIRVLKIKIHYIYMTSLKKQWKYCSCFPESFVYYDKYDYKFGLFLMLALKINPKHKFCLRFFLMLNSLTMIKNKKLSFKEYFSI